MAGKRKINPKINIFDNAELIKAGLEVNYTTKNDTNFGLGVDKTFLKDSDDKVDNRISASVSKDTEDFSYGVNAYKEGKNRGFTAGVTVPFNTGGEVEIGKGKDYIKDLL